MRSMILTSAAALALAAPAAAQDAATDAETDTTAQAEATAGSHTMNVEQQTAYDAWPSDRQAAYDAWPGEIQVYYWTLTPTRQAGWWALTDAQRVQVYEMTPAQRITAWTQIDAQMSGAAATASAATPAPAGNMRFVSSAMVQNVPPPKEEYPICTDGMTDGCINPRAAGKNYGNVPLEYWPGRPASEIEEPLPAEKPAASDEPEA